MHKAASWTWIGLTLLLLGTECSSQQSLPAQGTGGNESSAGRTGTGGLGSGGNGVGGYVCDGVGVIPGNCFGGTTGTAGHGIGGEHGVIGGTGAGGTGTGGIVIETIGGMSGSLPDAGPDAVVCCPPDPQPTGCTHLGGASFTGMCYTTCDFWDSSRWRIETDAYGCRVWRYDFTGGCSPDASSPKFCLGGGDGG